MSEQQQGGQRRNQNGNRNNNNRNRNRNNNRNNNNRNQNGNRGPRKHTPKPLKLTLWQKILKSVGLFNEEKARKKQQLAKKQSPQSKSSTPARNNTRVAKPRKAPEKVEVETPRLYIGNLSYDAGETDIEELFKGIGNVKKVEIIYNRHTHRSKGYGFVQMYNVDDAKRAVDVLHDQPFLGRNLIVNGSKARNPSDPSASNNDAENTDDSDAAA